MVWEGEQGGEFKPTWHSHLGWKLEPSAATFTSFTTVTVETSFLKFKVYMFTVYSDTAQLPQSSTPPGTSPVRARQPSR
jgi:hypothetical protein